MNHLDTIQLFKISALLVSMLVLGVVLTSGLDNASALALILSLLTGLLSLYFRAWFVSRREQR
jgi:hypothetical protein